MTARTGVHEVRNPIDAQVPAEWPIEGWVDPLSGRRLHREYLGQVSGSHLIIGNIARSTGIDLYYKRSMGNPKKPQPSEIDHDLKRFIEHCWTTHLRRSGKPKVARYGANLIWLALMPLGCHGTETGPGGGRVLYRFVPLVRRPREALPVALAGSN